MERIKTNRLYYFLTVTLWAVFVLPSSIQTGYFYLDDPAQLLMAERGSWWTPPDLNTGRHLPIFNLYRKLIFSLAGATPSAFYLIQSCVILATWVGLMWIVRRLTYRDRTAQKFLLLVLISGSLAESAFTLGKHEPVTGLLIAAYIIVCVLHFESRCGRVRLGSTIGLGVLSMLAVWNKETAILVPVLPLIVGIMYSKNATCQDSLGARLRFAAPSVLISLLGVALAKTPMFFARATAVKLPEISYTKYDITSKLVVDNLFYYLHQTPEAYAFIFLGLILAIIMIFSNDRRLATAFGVSCTMVALCYVLGLSIWRFSLPYYMYPVSLLAALGLSLTVSGLALRNKAIAKFVTVGMILVIIPIQTVVACQHFYLANAQRMATNSSQKALEWLLHEIPTDREAKVFLMNFPNPSEAPVQFENMLKHHYGRNVECFGALDLIETVEGHGTSALFANQKQTPYPEEGNYLVTFISDMRAPWHMRAVSPSYWSNSLQEKTGLETLPINRKTEQLTIPLVSWEMPPRFYRMQFGVEVNIVKSAKNAGKWTGRWSDGWVSKTSHFMAYQNQRKSFQVSLSAFAPTTPNEVEILRGGDIVLRINLPDDSPQLVSIPAGDGVLHFKFKKAVSPMAVGINADSREIAGMITFVH